MLFCIFQIKEYKAQLEGLMYMKVCHSNKLSGCKNIFYQYMYSKVAVYRSLVNLFVELPYTHRSCTSKLVPSKVETDLMLLQVSDRPQFPVQMLWRKNLLEGSCNCK